MNKLIFGLIVYFSLACADNSWDYLLLVTRWPGTIGYGVSLPSNVTYFTLHGVWPTRNDGSWPQFCNNSYPFEPNQIESLVSNLWVYWYDYQGNGYSFWSHEWEKHGTCAGTIPQMADEYDYFSAALQLAAKYNPVGAFGSSITPSNSQTYSLSSVTNTFANYFNVEPIVTCLDVSLGTALDMVQLCVNKQFQLESCPTNLITPFTGEGECSTEIYVPEIQYSN